jgi:hypothetical protein
MAREDRLVAEGVPHHIRNVCQPRTELTIAISASYRGAIPHFKDLASKPLRGPLPTCSKKPDGAVVSGFLVSPLL